MKAIAFDFDGTLVDTEPIHEAALRVAAELHGATIHEGETIGHADEDALSRAFRRAGVPFDDAFLLAACREKTAAYLDLIADAEITVYDGALELVRAAAERVPLAICTAAVRPEVLPVLERLGIKDLIGVLVCADDVEAKKPHPAGYIETVRLLGVEPATCVVLEDSQRGVAAAKGAGCPVLALGHTTDRAHLGAADAFAERIADVNLDVLMRLISDAIHPHG